MEQAVKGDLSFLEDIKLKVTLSWDLKERSQPCKEAEEAFQDKGNGKHKFPAVGPGSACPENWKKAVVAAVEFTKGKMA